jgi:hypothetical protein
MAKIRDIVRHPLVYGERARQHIQAKVAPPAVLENMRKPRGSQGIGQGLAACRRLLGMV